MQFVIMGAFGERWCDVRCFFSSGGKDEGYKRGGVLIHSFDVYAAAFIFFDFVWAVRRRGASYHQPAPTPGADLCLVQVPAPREMRAGDVLDTLDRVALFRAQAADSHRRVENIGGDLDSAISLLDLGQSRRALQAAHGLKAQGKTRGTSLLAILCALRTNC